MGLQGFGNHALQYGISLVFSKNPLLTNLALLLSHNFINSNTSSHKDGF